MILQLQTLQKKTNVIYYYNHNKVDVDVFDKMVRLYTTHAATRRWPMVVWTNILDMAGLNSWTLFRKATGSRISRRAFNLQLSKELTSAYVSSNKKGKLNDPEEDCFLLESDKNVLENCARITQEPFASVAESQPAENVVLVVGS